MDAISRDVEAAKQGDRRAYARLVDRHQRIVVSIALAITSDVAASEDAAQEAFLAGWRDLSKLDNLASFGPWICQIARNRAHDIVRNREKTKPAIDGEIEAAPDPEPGALEGLLESERSRLITGALQALPEDGREAMILFYREGQSISQVAQTLEVSEDVIKKRLSRARERIRESVEASLGAALIATIPGGDFCAHVLGRISAPTFLPRPRLWSKLRAAKTAAKAAGIGAVAILIARPPKYFSMLPPLPPPVSVIAPPRAPEIRGKILGERNATGTATLDCQDDHRTVKIEKGAFDVRDLPVGVCHVTFALDGLPDPEPQDLKLEENEIFQYKIKITKSPPPPMIKNDKAKWE